jgi:lipid-A-disaccharide synthase
MQSAGATSWFSMEKLAVRGYVEVLKSFREILSIRRSLRNRMLAEKPAMFIGIDAPDFNLGLEKTLKRAGIPTVHYVSPSIWAWRGERIHKIKQSVDHMLTVFPFEPEIYREAGIAATFVGHPTADVIPQTPQRDNARTQLRLKPHELRWPCCPAAGRANWSTTPSCSSTRQAAAARFSRPNSWCR